MADLLHKKINLKMIRNTKMNPQSDFESLSVDTSIAITSSTATVVDESEHVLSVSAATQITRHT